MPMFFIYADEARALREYYNGFKPCFSTGICGSLTAGYGRLSDNGYWEYPLPTWFMRQHGMV